MSLQSFRARHSAALNKNSALKATTPSIDLSHYKSVLKDQQAVQLAEKVLGEFKPVDYDVSKWNGVVEAFEGKAVSRKFPKGGCRVRSWIGDGIWDEMETHWR